MKIAIIGAGAIGLYLSAQFTQAGHDVFVLARSNFSILQGNRGFLLESNNGSEFVCLSDVCSDINDMPKCDLVILCTHLHHNRFYLDQLHKILTKNSVLITVQNGLRFEEDIIQALPNHIQFFSAVCWIKVNNLAPNQIRHAFFEEIRVGKYHPASLTNHLSQEDMALLKALSVKGVKFIPSTSIATSQVEMLSINVPAFLMCNLFDYSIEELRKDKACFEICLQLHAEILAAATQAGCEIDMGLIERVVEKLHDMPPLPSVPAKIFMKRMRQELPHDLSSLLEFFEDYEVKVPLLEKYAAKLI